jgi:hypothetical protein
MSPSVTADVSLRTEVELRFERQPIDVARLVMGVAFQNIDEAVIQAAAGVEPGDTFLAEVPGWDVYAERSRERVIRVMRIVPAKPGRRARAAVGFRLGERVCDSRLAS